MSYTADERKAYNRDYYRLNRAQILAKRKSYRAEHSDEQRAKERALKQRQRLCQSYKRKLKQLQERF